MRRGALTSRLEKQIRLSDGEYAALDEVQRAERRLPPGTAILREGEPNDSLFIVQHGWLHSSRRLRSGDRQILRFHYAGDLIGTSSIAWATAADTLTTVDDCILYEVPKAAIGRLFDTHGRLGGLLYAVAAAEAVAASDRLTSVGRMQARDRIMFLLLDMLARLRVTAGGVVDAFTLPLTQTDLGDAVGLTKVHVSRTMSELERTAEIKRDGKRIRLVDEAGAIERLGFFDRYQEVATDWLPPPSSGLAAQVQ